MLLLIPIGGFSGGPQLSDNSSFVARSDGSTLAGSTATPQGDSNSSRRFPYSFKKRKGYINISMWGTLREPSRKGPRDKGPRDKGPGPWVHGGVEEEEVVREDSHEGA